MLMSLAIKTEEEGDALRALEKIFKDLEFEDDTGLPAIAQLVGPADGSMSDAPEGF